MKRPITRKQHGIADWTYAPLTAFSPELLGFRNNRPATYLVRAMGGAIAGISLITRYEWGLYKVVPFKVHLASDVGLGVFSLAAPWLFKFSGNMAARNTFLFIGISSLLIGGLLTQRKNM